MPTRLSNTADAQARRRASGRYRANADGLFVRGRMEPDGSWTPVPCSCSACLQSPEPATKFASQDEGVEHEMAALQGRRATWKNLAPKQQALGSHISAEHDATREAVLAEGEAAHGAVVADVEATRAEIRDLKSGRYIEIEGASSKQPAEGASSKQPADHSASGSAESAANEGAAAKKPKTSGAAVHADDAIELAPPRTENPMPVVAMLQSPTSSPAAFRTSGATALSHLQPVDSEAPQLAAGHACSETVTWLTCAINDEDDPKRRAAMSDLLAIAIKLKQQPPKADLRSLARDLQVRQRNLSMNKLYDAVVAKVEENAKELRTHSQEGPAKKPCNLITVSRTSCGSADNNGDAAQLAGITSVNECLGNPTSADDAIELAPPRTENPMPVVAMLQSPTSSPAAFRTSQGIASEALQLAARRPLNETMVWLIGAFKDEGNSERRAAIDNLLTIACKLKQQPSKNVLRSMARDLKVHRMDRPMNELYDAVLSKVEERVDDLRTNSQERSAKKRRDLRTFFGASSSSTHNSSDASQFAAAALVNDAARNLPAVENAAMFAADGRLLENESRQIAMAQCRVCTSNGETHILKRLLPTAANTEACLEGAGGASSSCSGAVQLTARAVRRKHAAGPPGPSRSSNPTQLPAQHTQKPHAEDALDEDLHENATKKQRTCGAAGTSYDAHLAVDDDALTTAELLSNLELEARFQDEVEAGTVWLTQQLAIRRIAWCEQLLQMASLLRERPSTNETQGKVRAMAARLSVARGSKTSEELHASCLQEWLARLRGLRAYARAGVGARDGCSGSSDAAQLAAVIPHKDSAAHRNRSRWWLHIMGRTLKAFVELKQQAPNQLSPEDWQRWTARLRWACGARARQAATRPYVVVRPSFRPIIKEWLKNDEAWWSQHGLRIKGVQTRQRYGDDFVHYNACVLLASDIERIVGIAVPENPCEVLASAPTAEMPRTLLAFKVALRQMSADNCLPFGVHAPSANVIRQLALIELLEMRYVDLPLREAPLIALVQEARLRRRNAASTHGADAGGALQPSMLPVTGEEVVAHLMAYVRQTRYL